MDIQVRWVGGDLREVRVWDESASIVTSLLSEVECKELAAELLEAASELLREVS